MNRFFLCCAFCSCVAFAWSAENNIVIYEEQSNELAQAQISPTQSPARENSAKENSSPSPTNPAPAQGRTHTVAPGETLMSIGRAYGVSAERIQSRNHLETEAVSPGQVLQIPDEAPLSLSAVTTTKPALKADKPSPAPVTAPPPAAPKPTFAERLLAEARKLAKLGLDYNQSWKPEGARKSLVMDCSNTSRYLYWRVAGIDIGRTASDQYYFLRLKNRAWEVERDSNGAPSLSYLKRVLRPGDLLFWEHTYKPVRKPPITHVCVYLGQNSKGDWIMAGSQQNARMPNGQRRSGPGIYIFEPQRPNGGYSTFFGFKRVRGRFVAIGRPLGSVE
jgi:LysM repeat protein